MTYSASFIGSLYSDLIDSLALLRDQLLGSCDLENSNFAQVQRLSFAGKSDHGRFIPPSVTDTFLGLDAVGHAANDCLLLKRLTGQPPLSVYRSIGVVACSNAAIETIKNINLIKTEIKALLTSLSRGDRKRVVDAVAPGVVLIQLYRHIAYLDLPSTAVRPSWIASGASSFSVSCSELRKQLYLIRAARSEAGQDFAFIEQDLARIASFSDDYLFKVVRSSRPHVKYNIRGVSGAWFHYPANLPLFVSQTMLPIQYQRLSDVPPAPVSKKGTQEMLISWMGVAA